jgi:23S rRNA pseudouridine1911/1915/1917 synthase
MDLKEHILYEDEHVVVLNKPVSILVHGNGFTDEVTVAEWFAAYCPAAVGVGEVMRAQNGEAILRPGIVHRLDKDTSGVLVLAKDQDTFLSLKAQFQNRETKKLYRAIVHGQMKDQWGTVNRPVGRSATDPKKRSAEGGAKGTLREAVTHWQLLENGVVADKPYAALELRPETGRTHQLRVHLKSIGRPIVGDTLYLNETLLAPPYKAERLYLHAHSLTIAVADQTHTFVAPLPEAFTTFFG